jgi:L-lactate dehydrogenase (cytochrome)
MTCADVEDFRRRARARLPRFLFDYVDGGAWGEETLDRNVADFRRLAVRQRVMRDVSRVDLSATLFGQHFSMPVGLGPVGLAGMYARRGEVQAARAAEAARVPFALSTLSLCGLEEVGAGTTRPFWFQLYMVKDRGFVREMIARAKAVGCTALLFTVDLPVPAVRRRDLRSGLSGPRTLASRLDWMWEVARRPAWAWNVGLHGRPHACGNVAPVMRTRATLRDYWAWIGANFDAAVTWKDLDEIRAAWDGPLVIKGVLDVEDARAAVETGADGLVVSNHGGRQLDGAPSSISVLPAIADAVGGRTTLLMDGGVRSGTDVLKALASGADGVLLGRAWAYALAADGGRGVEALLAQFRAELAGALALAGRTSVQGLSQGDPVLVRTP